MIINASGRCDICAYYSKWFMNRLKQGYVDVRNPFDSHQISRIMLDHEHIDLIVFCTKNPIPMLEYIDEITFPMLFHVTLSAYHQDLESGVPNKKQIIEAIKVLSEKLGKDRVVLRYDPIIITERYHVDYHKKAMETLLKKLQFHIEKVVFSFVDMYKNTREHFQKLHIKECSKEDMLEIGKAFGTLGKKYNVTMQTCAEEIDLSAYGVHKGNCFDYDEITSLLGYAPNVSKKGVRQQCDCIESVDIGDYNCCYHGCCYCYANYDASCLEKNRYLHDENSSVLLGKVSKNDRIHVRKGGSKHHQMKLKGIVV